MNVYRDGLVGPAPAFPASMERRIANHVEEERLLLQAAAIQQASASAALPPDQASER